MCTCCGTASKIFAVEIVTREPVNTDVSLYKEIAHRLFQNKVASNVNVGNNRAYLGGNKQFFAFDLHLDNINNPDAVNLANVEQALHDLIIQFEGYDEMTIKIK